MPTENSAPARQADPRRGDHSAIRRVALASGIGTAVELYDFIIYGLASAIVFNQVFFITEDPLLGTLISFMTMGAGFLARPLGGIVFGHFGDRIGRKQMLVITLTATGLCTMAIGMVPSAHSIGGAAAIIVVVLRVLQGFFMGGEQGGAFVLITESAPAGHKTFYGGWATSGSPVGSILGTLAFSLSAAVSGDAFLDWGWRIPFLASAVLIFVGLYIRLRLDDSPEFEEIKSRGERASAPLLEVMRRSAAILIAGVLVNAGFNATIFIVNSFSMAYGTEALGMERNTILMAGLIGSVAHLITVLASAKLADRVGMTPVMMVGCLLMIAWAFPFFAFFEGATTAGATIAIVGGYACSGVVFGSMAHWFSALFPPRFRYSGVSLSFQVGAVLGGGLSPTIATQLLRVSGGETWAISTYLVAAGVVAAIGLLIAKGSAGMREAEDERRAALAAR